MHVALYWLSVEGIFCFGRHSLAPEVHLQRALCNPCVLVGLNFWSELKYDNVSIGSETYLEESIVKVVNSRSQKHLEGVTVNNDVGNVQNTERKHMTELMAKKASHRMMLVHLIFSK
eukprot:TRINITY_DN73552_c0_g1_i1.p2 TRINITY_DN73552_c0_g1~~TRINITY_DN73552_c0_g1_i1.p2  ORF type:complete len:117 (+),score=11.15 TRINITY_DN73552_c0_g1_i1:340-690(+)